MTNIPNTASEEQKTNTPGQPAQTPQQQTQGDSKPGADKPNQPQQK